MRSITATFLGAAVVLLLAACGEREPDVALTEGDPATPAAEDLAAPGAPAEPAPSGMTETATLQEVQGSGVGGDVTVRDLGAQSEVMVRLTGTPGNTTHPGHIHSGRCDSIGGVVQPLEPITTDATGTGSMTTTVGVPGMTAMDGQHIVVYHGAGGAPVACADIPAHAM